MVNITFKVPLITGQGTRRFRGSSTASTGADEV
jgi:hypothetical protein